MIFFLVYKTVDNFISYLWVLLTAQSATVVWGDVYTVSGRVRLHWVCLLLPCSVVGQPPHTSETADEPAVRSADGVKQKVIKAMKNICSYG